MKIIGVIPARYGSTRFEGKPLKKIAGRPLLEWVVQGAKKAKSLTDLIVATDDARIADLATRLGVKAVMTDSSLPSGSDRVWAAVAKIDCDFVINIQGDEPLVTGEVLDTLALAFKEKPSPRMVTLARRFKNLEELNNPNTAKIVLNARSEALYFSRLPIPFSKKAELEGHLKHIGLYGYEKGFLRQFCELGPVPLEQTESLEQLRALWLGAAIKVVLTEYESWGVDHPEDVVRIETILSERSRL